MWKLIFVARRGWKMIPKEHRRTIQREALKTVRQRGPTVARQVRSAVKQARKG